MVSGDGSADSGSTISDSSAASPILAGAGTLRAPNIGVATTAALSRASTSRNCADHCGETANSCSITGA